MKTKDIEKDIEKLIEDFNYCKKILIALGDENRQHLILEMLKTNECDGIRVGKIAEKTHLSRPAVSHHLQILKNAGIIKVRKEATKNFYYFEPDMASFEKLIGIFQKSIEITSSMSNRNSEED